MNDELRDILSTFGGLSVSADSLGDDADLFAAGLSSLATVNVMLAIEQRFDIEIPDDLLTRKTFQTIASLTKIIGELRVGALPA
jgi:acyl carrier protein